MNYDDNFTKQFEDKFQKNLKLIRNMPPEVLVTVKENLLILGEAINEIKANPNKSDDDLKMLKEFKNSICALNQQLEDIHLILSESMYRQSLAYFENVKRLAKAGDKKAEEIYNDLKEYFERFDSN